jgi:hypothetical protein
MSDAQQNMIEGLMTRLTADSAFNTAIGGDANTAGRIYDGAPPEAVASADADDPFLSVPRPFATVSVVADDDVLTFDGDDIDADVQIDIYADADGGAKALRTIGGDLYDRLHHASFNVTGYNGAVAQSRSRGAIASEGRLLRLTANYNIKAS